jgi:hypothetical protein
LKDESCRLESASQGLVATVGPTVWIWNEAKERWQSWSTVVDGSQPDRVVGLERVRLCGSESRRVCVSGVVESHGAVIHRHQDNEGVHNQPLNVVDVSKAVPVDGYGVIIADRHALHAIDLTKPSLESEPSLQTLPVPPSTFPSLQQTLDQVIEHLSLHLERIDRWRSRARWRTLLPDLSFNYDTGSGDRFGSSIWGSSSQQLHYQGPDSYSGSEDSDWGVRVSWDFGDWLFNTGELTVEQRWEDLLDVRDQYLTEASSLYYEWLRLRHSLCQQSAGIQVETVHRLLSTQARLDVLTGWARVDQLQVTIYKEDSRQAWCRMGDEQTMNDTKRKE